MTRVPIPGARPSPSLAEPRTASPGPIGRAFALALAALALFAMPSFTRAEIVFDSRFRLADLAAQPRGLATGDFNGDGRADACVATGLGPSYIEIVLAGPDGAPLVPWRITPGLGASEVAVGDVNEDGLLDAIAGSTAGFSVLFGNGDGTLVDGPTVAHGLQPSLGLVLADVNGDGHRDVVSVAVSSSELRTFFGVGDGTFQAPVPDTLFGSIRGLASGRLNGDARDDLACLVGGIVGYWQATALLGRADGHFDLSDDFPFSYGTSDPGPIGLLADLDGDTDLDYLCGRDWFAQVPGSDGRPIFTWSFVLGVTGDLQGCADANDDGYPDVFDANAVTSYGFERYPVAPTPQPPSFHVSVESIERLALGDVNGDTFPDVVVAGQGGAHIAFHRNDGEGGFGDGIPTTIFGGAPAPLEYVDVTGDGVRDAVFANVTNPNALNVLPGTAGGGWGVPYAYGPIPTFKAFALGDLDGDGDLDAVFTHPAANRVSWCYNGGGAFGPRDSIAVANGPYAVALGDVTNDGALDAVVTCSGFNQIALLRSTGTAPNGVVGYFTAGNNPVAITLGDLTGDGRLDAFVLYRSTASSCQLALLRGNAVSTFLAPQNFTVNGASKPVGVRLAEVTGDTIPDVIALTEASAAVYPGLATNTLGARVSPTSPVRGVSMDGTPTFAIADFDRDGALDLAIPDAGGNGVEILRGLGNGTFEPERGFGVGRGARGCVAHDLDENGTPDLLVALASEGAIATVMNRTPPLSAAPESGVVASAPVLRVTPNPSRGPVALEFATAETSPVRFECFDVAGRRVWFQVVTPAGGRARAEWRPGESLADGLVFARATQSGRSAAARIARVR